MSFNFYKNKFFINIAVIAIFLVLTAIFVIYPAMAEIYRVNQEITTERIKLEQKLALGLNIKKITQDLVEIEQPATQLDQIFIQTGQELEFVNQLEAIAARQSVGLEFSSDFIGSALELNVSQVEIEVILSGEYRQLLKFIAEAERMGAYFNLRNLTFSKRTGPLPVVVQLSGQIYFKK